MNQEFAKAIQSAKNHEHDIGTLMNTSSGAQQAQCQRCGRSAFFFPALLAVDGSLTQAHRCSNYKPGDGILQGFPRS